MSIDTLVQEPVMLVTWEAIPSESSGVLPGIHTATLEQKREYTTAMRRLIQGEEGNDKLLDKLGGVLCNLAEQEGSFSGRISPNVTVNILAGNTYGGYDRTIADAYASAIGYIFTQDAVAWHRTDTSTEGKDTTFGVCVTFYDNLDDTFTESFYAHVRSYVPDAEFSKVGDEFRFINFCGALPDSDFKEGIQEALRTFEAGVAYGTVDLRVESNYLENKKPTDTEDTQYGWETYKAGEGYAQQLAGAGKSDLLSWLDVKRQQAHQLNQEFAENYGWAQLEQAAPYISNPEPFQNQPGLEPALALEEARDIAA